MVGTPCRTTALSFFIFFFLVLPPLTRLTECSLAAEKVRRASYLSLGAKELSACRHITLRAHPIPRRRASTSPTNSASYAIPVSPAPVLCVYTSLFRPVARILAAHTLLRQNTGEIYIRPGIFPRRRNAICFVLSARIRGGLLLTCLRPR